MDSDEDTELALALALSAQEAAANKGCAEIIEKTAVTRTSPLSFLGDRAQMERERLAWQKRVRGLSPPPKSRSNSSADADQDDETRTATRDARGSGRGSIGGRRRRYTPPRGPTRVFFPTLETVRRTVLVEGGAGTVHVSAVISRSLALAPPLRTIFFASAPIPVLPALPTRPRPLPAYRSRQHSISVYPPPLLRPSHPFPPPTSHPHVYIANPLTPQVSVAAPNGPRSPPSSPTPTQASICATRGAGAAAGWGCIRGWVGAVLSPSFSLPPPPFLPLPLLTPSADLAHPFFPQMILGTLLPLPTPAPESDPEATGSDTESEPEPESSSDVEIVDSEVDEEGRGQPHAWLYGARTTLRRARRGRSARATNYELSVVMRLDTEEAVEGAVAWERPSRRYGKGDILAENPFFQ
ncbi:hypothetical protein K438DRAFT_1965490 [Mycena galopus ATCC 62051]|nr:hypothetical protein K438DRAFT_1965490 [Mycena galopus ATCC 62051]